MPQTSFPGRVIVDHRPKTGGIALSAWLAGELGSGCVSTALMGTHQDLIRSYGGAHSIIIAHVEYTPGDTLDPRYQYVTWLRNPVDRVISWLFYVLHDATVDERQIRIREAAELFLKTDGKECPREFLPAYNNHYVGHFSAIVASEGTPQLPGNASDDSKLAAALAALSQYDLVGIYEDFPEFTAELACLLGISAPASLRRLNVSTRHSRQSEISPALRERIEELNQEDMKLYSEAVKWKKEKQISAPAAPETNTVSGWVKYNLKPSPLVRLPTGSAFLTSAVPSLTVNEHTTLCVDFKNRCSQNWDSGGTFPIRASYHWLRPSGEIFSYDGERTALPGEGLSAGQAAALEMGVVAPSEPGTYTLVISLVQERFSWLELRGFEPAIVQVEVRPVADSPKSSPLLRWIRKKPRVE